VCQKLDVYPVLVAGFKTVAAMWWYCEEAGLCRIRYLRPVLRVTQRRQLLNVWLLYEYHADVKFVWSAPLDTCATTSAMARPDELKSAKGVYPSCETRR
jgi:hypothetical protein